MNCASATPKHMANDISSVCWKKFGKIPRANDACASQPSFEAVETGLVGRALRGLPRRGEGTAPYREGRDSIRSHGFRVRTPVPRGCFRRVPPLPKAPVNWAHSPVSPRRGFTLIELLVVIAVISILAALIIPIGKAVNRRKIIAKARAELAQTEMAIGAYKIALGHYPPDNPLNPLLNQLYFELKGTTNTGVVYRTLDGSAEIAASPTVIANHFPGVSGFINSTAPGGSDEGRRAKSFLPDLKPGQIGDISTGGSERVKILVCSVPWPDKVMPFNPIRYNSSSPTNNPGAFDLWIDVIIDGKTNRISNWSREPIIVNSAY
jgi:prepilin-type N-terminal cleavage/methylation domain-containing protein